MSYQLAQVNFSRLLAPIDDPQLAEFVAALDPVNAAAEATAGFVWRLQDENGNATAIQAFDWDVGDSSGVIVNLSVWTDVQHLAAFVYGSMHREILRRRREWFAPMADAATACWWIRTNYRPTTLEAEDRIRQLRAHGPGPRAFTLGEHYPPPDELDDAPTTGPQEWFCPA